MEHAARVAQVAVRDDLRAGTAGRVRAASGPAEDQPAVLEHADLPPVLVLDVAGGLLPATASGSTTARRPRCTSRYGSARSWPKRGSSSDVVLAANGADRPDAAGDRAEPRLVPPQPALEARVDPLAVRAVRPLVEVASRRRTRRPGRRSCARACAARPASRACSRRRTRGSRRRSRAPPDPAPRPCRRAGARAGGRADRARRPRRRARRCGRSRRRRRRRARACRAGSRARAGSASRRSITTSSSWAATMNVTVGSISRLRTGRPRTRASAAAASG